MSALYNKSYAIIIGISKLQDSRAPFTTIPNAINDAKEIARILEEKCDFKNSDIFQMYDEHATRKEIMKQIKLVNSKIKKGDRLLVFFAGHGNSRPTGRGQDGYIIPYDSEWNGGQPVWKSVIGFNNFTKMVASKSKATQILFLVDCCFSGIACELRGMRESVVAPAEDMVASATKRRSVEVFAASSMNEKIVDSTKRVQHSIFTEQILDFIENVKPISGYNTGYVSARQMVTEVTGKAVAESLQIGHRQQPQFVRCESDGLGEFVIRKFTAEEIAASTTEPLIQYSEIDYLVNEAGLTDTIQNVDSIRSILTKVESKFPGKSLTTSSIYSAIYDFLKSDEYVTDKLRTLKETKGLTEPKVEEIISHLCINILARGVKEEMILTNIPVAPPLRETRIEVV